MMMYISSQLSDKSGSFVFCGFPHQHHIHTSHEIWTGETVRPAIRITMNNLLTSL